MVKHSRAKISRETPDNPDISSKRANVHSCHSVHSLFFQFTEIIFVDHQTGSKVYFKRQVDQPITAAGNYGNAASTYGSWFGFGTNSAYSYQLLICDHSRYSGFLVSGYRDGCDKHCDNWCGDSVSPYFRTANSDATGVAFNSNGHRNLNKRLVSVGLR